MGQTITVNRAARHEYFVLETYEAGIELYGTEIKSIRNGSVNLKESWADIQNGEVFINGMHISPYELAGKIKQEGLTLIPLSLYFKKQYVKVELGLCKGKKLYDKRDAIAKRDAKRDIDRAMKERTR